MKGWHWVCLALFSNTVGAQVKEMWQTSLTNVTLTEGSTGLTYVLGSCSPRAAATDRHGNTIIGGVAWAYDNAPFVAKFNSQGQKLWEHCTDFGSNCDLYEVALDGDGGILFTSQLGYVPYPTFLTKLSPGGELLWQLNLPKIQPSFHAPPIGLRVDSRGNAILLRSRGPDRVVIKIAPDGQILWESALPDPPYPPSGEGLWKSLALTPDDRVVVVGGRYLESFSGEAAFVATLDREGQLIFSSNDFKGEERPYFYSSVSLSPKGTICASALLHFTGTFSSKGLALHTQHDIGGQVQDSNEAGSIVRQGESLYSVGVSGQARWTLPNSGTYGNLIGVLPSSNGSWLVAGGWPGGPAPLEFLLLDRTGKIEWQTSVGDYSYATQFWTRTLNSLLRAPDGTLRVVVYSAFSATPRITLAAFAVDDL